MKRIIQAIEDKLEKQETELFVRDYEISELKRKLAEAEKTIEAQAKEITDLKGANA